METVEDTVREGGKKNIPLEDYTAVRDLTVSRPLSECDQCKTNTELQQLTKKEYKNTSCSLIEPRPD